MAIEIRDVDKRIWEEELEDFVPQKIYDAHVHIYLPEHDLEGKHFASLDWIHQYTPRMDHQELRRTHELLFPGREVHSLLFGWPFDKVDFDGINQFVTEQASLNRLSVPFMLVPPTISQDYLAKQIDSGGFLGLKPYLVWTKERWNASITDIIPEKLLEVADEKKLIITLHLSKKTGVADEQNIKQLVYLSGKYPKVRWIMAHAARACSVVWPLERAIDRIKDLPNLWYDVSSVTNSNVYSLLFRKVPLERIMYGSDIPSDLARGKLIGFGYAWALMTEDVIAHLDTDHCDCRPTFVLYETLRSARWAILREGFSREQIEDFFFNNAVKLLGLAVE